MATKLLITSVQAFCFKPCSVAMAFVIAFLFAFIDFMGGNMVPCTEQVCEDKQRIV